MKKREPLYELQCQQCPDKFPAWRSDALYCSPTCRHRAYLERQANGDGETEKENETMPVEAEGIPSERQHLFNKHYPGLLLFIDQAYTLTTRMLHHAVPPTPDDEAGIIGVLKVRPYYELHFENEVKLQAF